MSFRLFFGVFVLAIGVLLLAGCLMYGAISLWIGGSPMWVKLLLTGIALSISGAFVVSLGEYE